MVWLVKLKWPDFITLVTSEDLARSKPKTELLKTSRHCCHRTSISKEPSQVCAAVIASMVLWATVLCSNCSLCQGCSLPFVCQSPSHLPGQDLTLTPSLSSPSWAQRPSPRNYGLPPPCSHDTLPKSFHTTCYLVCLERDAQILTSTSPITLWSGTKVLSQSDLYFIDLWEE